MRFLLRKLTHWIGIYGLKDQQDEVGKLNYSPTHPISPCLIVSTLQLIALINLVSTFRLLDWQQFGIIYLDH